MEQLCVEGTGVWPVRLKRTMYYAGLFNQASKAMVAIYRALPAELHQDAGAEGRAAGISPFSNGQGSVRLRRKGSVRPTMLLLFLLCHGMW